MSQHLSTRNISSKSTHAFLSNLAHRQTDRQTNAVARAKTYTSSVVEGKLDVYCVGKANEYMRINFRLRFQSMRAIISIWPRCICPPNSVEISSSKFQTADFDTFRNSIRRPSPSWIFTISEFVTFRSDGCLYLELCTKFSSHIISYNRCERPTFVPDVRLTFFFLFCFWSA